MTTTRAGRVAAVVALGALLITASLPGSTGPAAVAAPASATAGSRALPTCTRDAAADLRWVTWLQEVFTGRRPSLAEAAPRLEDLSAGASYREVATGIATGDEAERRVVAATFQRFLHRPAGSGDLALWAPWTRANGPTALVGRVAGGAEAWARAGSTPEGWVGRLYLDVLGRAADPGGLAYWTGRLAAGSSRAQVAIGLWNTSPSLRARVDTTYRSFLGRPADTGGIAFWSPIALAHGDTYLAVSLAITPSGWNRAQVAYGGVAGAMPPACPPRLRWVPAPGTVVRDLRPVAHLGTRLVALTFDDGPDPTWTPQILRTLRDKGVPATFFVVSSSAAAHPDLVRQEVAEGHHVGTHSIDHPNLNTLGEAAQRRQIFESADAIDRIAGAGSVRCLRPPYGNHNATTDRLARERGLAIILWSRDGRDWAQPGVSTIVSGNLDTRFDGGRGVIILHDGGRARAQTVAALPILIDELRARGYRFVQLC